MSCFLHVLYAVNNEGEPRVIGTASQSAQSCDDPVKWKGLICIANKTEVSFDVLEVFIQVAHGLRKE